MRLFLDGQNLVKLAAHFGPCDVNIIDSRTKKEKSRWDHLLVCVYVCDGMEPHPTRTNLSQLDFVLFFIIIISLEFFFFHNFVF